MDIFDAESREYRQEFTPEISVAVTLKIIELALYVVFEGEFIARVGGVTSKIVMLLLRTVAPSSYLSLGVTATLQFSFKFSSCDTIKSVLF